MDLSFATTTELAAALRAGQVSSRELLDHALERIEAVDGPINAVVVLDEERARADATRADEELARGEQRGPLQGVVMTVKDVWETEGLVTTCGAPELRDHVPTADAVAVSRLRSAGAVIVGKTNTPVYAADNQTFNDVYGQTNNPWDLDRTPGGSSGGAAAAVATGMTPLELGSDIGGSIRMPAHCCGVYGLKPTWGIVPLRGHIPPPPGGLVEADVNVGGPMARSVDDLRLALDVIAGPLREEAVGWRLTLPDEPEPTSLHDLRLAITLDDPDYPVSRDVRDALRGLADALTDAGAVVDEVPPPVSIADGAETWFDLVLPQMGVALPDDVYDAFASVTPVPGDPASMGMARLTARFRDRARAVQRRHEQRRAWAAWFEVHDALVAPILQVPAFPHDHVDIPMRSIEIDGTERPGMDLVAWAGAIGVVLLPSVVVPAGMTAAGLPVGTQIVGPYLHDRRLLRIAGLVDEVGPGFRPPPGN
jgi:amidase